MLYQTYTLRGHSKIESSAFQQTIMSSDAISEIIDRTVALLGYREDVAIDDFANIMMFNDSEKYLAGFLWSHLQTGNWIFLSPKFILAYLTTEAGKCAVAHYIERTLMLDTFTYGEHYVRVLRDGAIADEEGCPTTKYNIAFDQSAVCCLPMKHRIQGHHYIASPSAVMSLLRIASFKHRHTENIDIRKIDSAFVVMREYRARVRKHIDDGRCAEIACAKAVEDARKEREEQERIAAREARIKHLKFPAFPNTPDGFIYINTSPSNESRSCFKVGMTKRSMSDRMSGYATGHPSFDRMECVYARECFRTETVEKMIRSVLAPYIENPDKKTSEMFVMGFAELRGIVDGIVDSVSRACVLSNQYLARKEEIIDTPGTPAPLPRLTFSSK